MTTGLAAPPPPVSAPDTSSTAVTTAYVPTPVMGDGTTAGSRARRRWRAVRWPLAVLLLVAIVAGLAALSRPAVSSTPLAPDNPGPSGARALAQVLGDQGVDVEYVTTTADAVSRALAGTTLLVTSDLDLLPEQIDALLETEADLVLVEPGYDLLEGATGGTATLADDWSSPDVARAPDCTDPDAVAAGSIRSTGFGLTATGPGSTVCFPGDDSPPDTGAYLVHEGERRVVALDDAALLTNSGITRDGNAALVLRSLGRHETLTWFVPSLTDDTISEDVGAGTGALPPWVTVVLVQLLVVAFFAALWRGRRLGRLVTEDLPVVVRASETTRGRGRLYRRSRSRGHAAAGLRAHSADRMASRLGLPRSAAAPALIDAIVRATHRPAEQVAHLLYGPPPADDAALLELARHLDQLESEVFHP
ncbi:DUF4350 domain-containing protein [Oerskovia enterophila]|uniref:DUF4350 domain-containing protein n=1 Tax=Oerskovia enterophila TaxID=43678 RepID=A0A161XBM6_9CELL|nr:DUF4350 domain-containing protein [Oerskovia enterophila]KZM33947.1 hypothetical protein OJAG_34310 [Oerskovia enterophila]